MAIGRISGAMLKANLLRQGVDLAVEDSLLYIDVSNGRVGINTDTPSKSLHIDNVTIENNQIRSTNGALDLGLPTDITISGGEANYVFTTDGSGTHSWQSIDAIAASGLNGMDIPLSTPDDSSLYPPGAINTWQTTTKVTNAIDDLNELASNIINNTAVANIDFTGTPLQGGEGTSVTLTITADGNPNRYTIDWGDGDVTTATTDSTPTHVYSDNSGSPYTVGVTAFNNSGTGTGSSVSLIREDYITIFTADPIANFDLYDVLSSGSALTGNDLYVIEGNSLYLENTTTNTSGADVTYTIDWGDGTSDDSVASDSASGGVDGTRLSHTYADGTSTGTGLATVTLTLETHSTATPGVVPASSTQQIKIYDDSPTPPDGLSTKTLVFNSRDGVNTRLAASFTDNTSGTTLSAGDLVERTSTTSGAFTSSDIISSFAWDADNGTLSAIVNDTVTATISLDSNNNTGSADNGIARIDLTSESDYNLLNASGSGVSFANSIYYPGLYKGFKARAQANIHSAADGVYSMKLSHSITGDTNRVEFVKDNMTSAPTVVIGTVSENTAGTYRYISGVPYYNTGSPTLTVSGTTIENFIGETYQSTSTPVEITNGSNVESTSGNVGSTQSYSFADIDGAVTMLSGGIPIAQTGVGSPYSIDDLEFGIASQSVASAQKIKIRAKNSNGNGSYSQTNTIIQVHTAQPTGVVEFAIPVADSLGNGVYTDDGLRIADFLAETTDNPSFNGATNFYTNNTFDGAEAVAGTQEATVRWGVLRHFTTDLSTGYLPAGPDRSSDTGTQYFTFAWRRQAVANFDINITSSTGIAGMWIAAPGTAIDSASTLNGWLDCSIQYAGVGIPGANTGNSGNGSNGCAFTGGDVISPSSALSVGNTFTLGSENASNATGNTILIRIALDSGQSISAISVTEASS